MVAPLAYIGIAAAGRWCCALSARETVMGFHRINIADEEILQRIVDGHSFKQMAFDWGIDGKTLWNRLDRMKRAANVNSLYQLVALVVASRKVVPTEIRRKN
jgi:FixJ family two-component response regulator